VRAEFCTRSREQASLTACKSLLLKTLLYNNVKDSSSRAGGLERPSSSVKAHLLSFPVPSNEQGILRSIPLRNLFFFERRNHYSAQRRKKNVS
jgi:hypothetical protein